MVVGCGEWVNGQHGKEREGDQVRSGRQASGSFRACISPPSSFCAMPVEATSARIVNGGGKNRLSQWSEEAGHKAWWA